MKGFFFIADPTMQCYTTLMPLPNHRNLIKSRHFTSVLFIGHTKVVYLDENSWTHTKTVTEL